MNKNVKAFLLLALSATIFLGSCKKDKETPNEEELITTLKLTFTDGVTTRTATFKDPDGDGGAAPTLFEEIVLAPSKTYTCTLSLLNESKSPADDITTEIQDEAKDHQFYFAPVGANITVSNLNNDGNGLPLGLTSTWTTGAVSSGTIKVTLKHKPGIKASGDPVTKGDTDIEVNFVAKVQ